MTTTDPPPVRPQDLDRAVEALEAVEDRAPLAALARDVLSGQAEGRALFAGAKLAQKKAEERSVTSKSAETGAGNLLSILERGAKAPLERALVAAFAVAGLEDALAEGSDEKSIVFRFVKHADWLEVSGDYCVYPLVDRLLSDERAELVWAELAQRVVDEAAGRDGDRPEVRARNAARLTALAGSSSASAKKALRGVVGTSALDEATRTLASTLAGDGADESAAVGVTVTGALGPAPSRGAAQVVRWITGWAILVWIARALGYLLGLRSRAELRLARGQLEVRTHLSMFGRTVREAEETWKLEALDGASRRVRYPSLHLVVGALALSAGILFGSLVLFDGVRSGELVLVLAAAGIVIAGAGLDLLLVVLLPARRGHVVMDLAGRSRRPLRLTSVPIEQADTFLRALRQASSKPG
ncbi:MAG: hypothetical protein H6719_11795 [Sandaracinaceae bacterium]|nr:hypothetical protein [Sandaracinaceae bacterium]